MSQETTIDALEAVHRDLVARYQAGDRALAPVVESVPQLYALVERYVPKADAAILNQAELRKLVLDVVVSMLEIQAERRADSLARTIR